MNISKQGARDLLNNYLHIIQFLGDDDRSNWQWTNGAKLEYENWPGAEMVYVFIFVLQKSQFDYKLNNSNSCNIVSIFSVRLILIYTTIITKIRIASIFQMLLDFGMRIGCARSRYGISVSCAPMDSPIPIAPIMQVLCHTT